LAIVLNEYPSDGPGDIDIPLVVDTNITRCKRCNAYINPFVTFLSSGQWRCNMCGVDNDGRDFSLGFFERVSMGIMQID